MNKFKTSAITILLKAAKPLHYKEITRLALERGVLETEGATMNAQIIMDIKRKGKLSDFTKTPPSTYALNPDKTQIEQASEEEQENVEKIYPNVNPSTRAQEIILDLENII